MLFLRIAGIPSILFVIFFFFGCSTNQAASIPKNENNNKVSDVTYKRALNGDFHSQTILATHYIEENNFEKAYKWLSLSTHQCEKEYQIFILLFKLLSETQKIAIRLYPAMYLDRVTDNKKLIKAVNAVESFMTKEQIKRGRKTVEEWQRSNPDESHADYFLFLLVDNEEIIKATDKIDQIMNQLQLRYENLQKDGKQNSPNKLPCLENMNNVINTLNKTFV